MLPCPTENERLWVRVRLQHTHSQQLNLLVSVFPSDLLFFLSLNCFYPCHSDEVGKTMFEQKTKLEFQTIKED